MKASEGAKIKKKNIGVLNPVIQNLGGRAQIIVEFISVLFQEACGATHFSLEITGMGTYFRVLFPCSIGSPKIEIFRLVSTVHIVLC